MTNITAKKYIEFRVYLQDQVDITHKVVLEAADKMQDLLANYACDDEAYPIFNQEVTFEIIVKTEIQ